MKKHLIKENDKIIIAFSCGPDSVYLFHKLNELKREYNLKLKLVYINHKIRNDIYDDIDFLKCFSEKYNVEYAIYEIDKENTNEEYCREFRYKSLYSELHKLNYNKIALGHNMNDNVETFLFRLIRGTTLDGLKSIQSERNEIIRPIIDEKKEDILEYLEKNNLKYRVDYTNNDNKYSRNKIRNSILPLMKEMNPKVIDKIQQIISEINQGGNDNSNLIINSLKSKNIKYTKNMIENILSLDNNGTKAVDVSDKYQMVNTYGKYYLKAKENVEILEKNLPLNNTITFYNTIIGFYAVESEQDKKNIVKNINMKYNRNNDNKIDIYLLNERYNTLKVGSYVSGDSIKLYNLGTKKIKKIFIDNKINKLERYKVPIIKKDKNVLLVSNIRYSTLVKKISTIQKGYIIYIITDKGEFLNE